MLAGSLKMKKAIPTHLQFSLLFCSLVALLLNGNPSYAVDSSKEKDAGSNSQAVRPVVYPKTNFRHYAVPQALEPDASRTANAEHRLSTAAAETLAEKVKSIFPMILSGSKSEKAEILAGVKSGNLTEPIGLASAVKKEATGSSDSSPKDSASQNKKEKNVKVDSADSKNKDSFESKETDKQENSSEKPKSKNPDSVLDKVVNTAMTAPPIGFLVVASIVAFAAYYNSKNKSKPASGSGGATASGASSDKTDVCRQWMQCALDQASQAETAASRAMVGSRDMRLAAAQEAQGHADSARNWAQKTSEKAYSASSPAQDAAAQARDAAARAQAAADRAKYNASTFTA